MSLKSLRIAIYARYSSDAQNPSSVDDQIERCQRYVLERGGEVRSDLIFRDEAISGASMQRPGLERLMRIVKARALDVLVVEDNSRLSRSMAASASLFEELAFAGVRLLGVGDGVDSAAPGSKAMMAFRAMMSDHQLDDLRDKTRRGLDARAKKGLSTGNLPYGYRSVAKSSYSDEGYEIKVDDAKADVVRRIFDDYLRGMSLSRIAKALHGEGVPPPRANTRHRLKGWCEGTVRAMLRNAKYAGDWAYNRQMWLKRPGTNTREVRPRPLDEVIRNQRPDLRIVPDETWAAVQERLCLTREKYTRHPDGSPKGRAIPNRANSYPLSGLLSCGVCSGPMVIAGTQRRARYKCAHAAKRGTCTNRLTVREDLARPRILGALRDRLARPEGLAYAREQLERAMRALGRTATAKTEEVRARLAKTQAKKRKLMEALEEGSTADSAKEIMARLGELVAEAKADQDTIAALERRATVPIALPQTEVLLAQVFELDRRLRSDPDEGRQHLATILKGGTITLVPHGNSHYVARAEVLPSELLLQTARNGDSAVNWGNSGGRI